MRKIISVLAVVGAATLGTVALTVGTASAHNATLSYDCFTVSAAYTDFGAGTHTATITINGTPHDVSFTGNSSTVTVPFVSHSGDPDVVVSTTYTSGNNQPKTNSATFPANSCAPPPPTVAPTTVNVQPEVVVRPTVAAAEAIVASPVFTG